MDEYYTDYESDSSSEIIEEICECQNDTPITDEGLCEYCQWKQHFFSGSLEDYSIYNPFWLQHFNQMGRIINKVERSKDGTPKEIYEQACRMLNEPKIKRNTPSVNIQELTYLRYARPITPPPVEKPEIKNWAGLFKSEQENKTETIYDILNISKMSSQYEIKKAYRKTALKMMADKKRTNDATEKKNIQEKYNKLETMFNELKF